MARVFVLQLYLLCCVLSFAYVNIAMCQWIERKRTSIHYIVLGKLQGFSYLLATEALQITLFFCCYNAYATYSL